MLYDFFNQISSTLIGPIMDIAYGLEHLPLLFAFFLGVVGAVAPCQLTSNISAITIYGNKSLVAKVPWLHVLLFVLGKVVVYSVLGIVIWLLGKEVYSSLSQIIDRKSTRLNSSHVAISYAVFCLKKKTH